MVDEKMFEIPVIVFTIGNPKGYAFRVCRGRRGRDGRFHRRRLLGMFFWAGRRV